MHKYIKKYINMHINNKYIPHIYIHIVTCDMIAKVYILYIYIYKYNIYIYVCINKKIFKHVYKHQNLYLPASFSSFEWLHMLYICLVTP